MLFEIDFDYGATFTEDEQKALAEASIVPVAFKENKLDWGRPHPIVDATTVAALSTKDRPVKVRRTISNGTTRRLSEFGTRTTTVVNERCSVAVAGLGLLTIDDVEVQEDLCTQSLQAKLDEGWRIVAVCVQPDQRRPDYILGRTRGIGAKP